MNTTQPPAAYVNIAEAATVFGVNRRTIEKKIASGEIHASQVAKEGRNTNIAFQELLRVFGAAKAPLKPQQSAKTHAKHDMRSDANMGANRENGHANGSLVALLQDQLAKSEAREGEWRKREREAVERAERAEADREKILGQLLASTETVRLLTAPKTEESGAKPRWWQFRR